MSSASSKVRTRMLSPGQSCTDFSPASRSRQSVVASGQRLQQRGLADAARAEDHRGGLEVRLGQPLVGGDDPERHQRASPSTSRNVGLPGFTVRAASKPSRIAAGQAPYLRSETRKVVSTYSAGIVAGGADARDHLAELGLVPLDLLRQVGDHRDLAVVEPDGAGVLALGAASGGGAVGVAERDGAVQPVGQRARGLGRVLGLLLQQRRAGRRAAPRSRRSASFGRSPSRGRLAGAFTTRPPR